MAEQVQVPGAGKVNRTWLVAGAAAIAGIVIVAYIRRSGQQDNTATEGEYSAGDQWSPDAYAGAESPGGETYDPNDVTGTFKYPTTNAEWTQRVVDMLSTAGYDITFAASTVGKYLSGQVLSASEKILMQSGIAMMGSPPAGALPILSGPEPTTSSTAKLPKPTLHYAAGDPRNTNYQLNWTRSAGAGYYLLERTAPQHRTILIIGTVRRTPPLVRGQRYSYRVRAISVTPGKSSSDWSNTVTFTVPR